MQNEQTALYEGGAERKNGGKLSLIAGIVALAVIALSILFTCLGGLTSPMADLGIFEFFNFGEGSVWDSLIALMGTEAGPNLGTLLQYILATVTVAATLIVLLVMLIRGIVMFVRGTKTGDFGKACGSAYGAYAAFLGGQVAILALFAGDPINYGLNAAAIAGAVICGVAVGATIVLRLLPSAKDVFADQKKMLHFILTACGMVCTVVVLALAGQPLVAAEGIAMNFAQYLGLVSPAGSTVDSTVLLTCVIGVIVTLLLILFSLLQLIRYFKQLAAPTFEQKKFRKATWLADAVCLFGLVAAIIGPMGIKGTDFAAAQIVILVFAVANFVLAIVDYVRLKDKANKQ